MTHRRVLRLSCLLLALLPPMPGRAAEPTNYDVPNKEWAKGPVRWIMTDEEEKEFKKLKTDDERAAFVKAFWDKRDPTPGTPQNEYKMIFAKRVEQADLNYKETVKIGSVSDMGRTFILLGPPAANTTNAREQVVWTYEPNEMTGIKAHLEMHFAQSPTGHLLLDRKELEQYVVAHPETRGIGWKLPVIAKLETPEAPAQAAPAEDQSPESQRQAPILDAALAKGGGSTAVPFQVTYDYYAAKDGTTLTAVSLEVPRDAAHGGDSASLLPYARLTPASPGGKPQNLTGDKAFTPAPLTDCPPGSFIYQARRNLPPGPHTVVVVVEDKVLKDHVGTLVQKIDVPDFAKQEFTLNDVTLLAGFKRIEEAPGPEEKERGTGPYVVGSFHLVPRANPTFLKNEALSFYYQVYNPASDAASGHFDLQATYTFFEKDGAAWKPFRKPIVKPLAGQVELYSIDLKDFLVPGQALPADFKMIVKVTDKVAKKDLTSEVSFSVR